MKINTPNGYYTTNGEVAESVTAQQRNNADYCIKDNQVFKVGVGSVGEDFFPEWVEYSAECFYCLGEGEFAGQGVCTVCKGDKVLSYG